MANPLTAPGPSYPAKGRQKRGTRIFVDTLVSEEKEIWLKDVFSSSNNFMHTLLGSRLEPRKVVVPCNSSLSFSVDLACVLFISLGYI